MRALGPWSLVSTPPHAAAVPDALTGGPSIEAQVPGTVAAALRDAGSWDFDHPIDFDERDWWYRCAFDATPGGVCRLHFHGLATLAQVWLNGTLILESSNMFQRHRVDVSERLQGRNELAICFRSLNAALAQRRPRPRWKTRLVRSQQLRWFRTTLLGRIPGWSPPVAPVGPWRAIELEAREPLAMTEVDVHASVEQGDGLVDLRCRIATSKDVAISATLEVSGVSAGLRPVREEGGYRLTGHLRLENPALWWPHTLGEPALHPCVVRIEIDGTVQELDCGPIGFRAVELIQTDGDFALRVNGMALFCRGACWTVLDIVTLGGTPEEYARTLTFLRDAGANMLRIGGTMVYENDVFYALCDQFGIVVWQDFMFANMDYPVGDESFLDSVRLEVTQQLRRLRRHPSLAVYCGNSEVEQQAAMMGAPPELWRNPLFAEILPELCARWHPGTVYVPSTPSGGALPFHTGTGITHYYGVGAYLRPLTDVRRANVRFTPECLGFANVPAADLIESFMGDAAPVTHDPRWKRRTPRDTGAGWDFEDVRDHYLRERFGVDPVRLRSVEPARYLELSRVTSGAVMAQVYSEWRRPGSSCHGALIWFSKDLWPGAGWGILDSRGLPKPCFYDLRRVWQPHALVLTDEGLDGIHAHVLNETAEPLDGTLELTLLRQGHVVVAQAATDCRVAARSGATVGADALLGAFFDTAYAYRFGPPAYDVAVFTLTGMSGEVVGEAFHFPVAGEPKPAVGAAVRASLREIDETTWSVTLTSDRFLYAAHLDVPGFLPDDDYFHLAPGRTKSVSLRAREGIARPGGFVEAVNLPEPVRILMAE